MTRRAALRLLAGATATAAPAVAGCERVASYIVSDDAVEQLGLETWTRLRERMPASKDAQAQRLASTIAQRLLVAAGGSEPLGGSGLRRA